ncbi:hypothetical protein B0I31_12742 [Saccharothrix carnea]|uniref:Uncharacterized protein n=1 Tax=Saccharothrix carnea TaxID=1280637 RepID=A0A2P8HGC2_SACCR|nr:hypothetical protein [Saccharothrix carnea]PSL45265.1 hypothetical protein B0I31_12742 [Saccharothrix carnea]
MARQHKAADWAATSGQTRTARLRSAGRAVLVGVATLVAIIGTTAAGSAAPVSPSGGNATTVVEVPMRFGGFDAAVAEANGYEIRTNPDGTQYSVKKGTPGELTTNNVVSGNCGTSWVWLNARGNREVLIDTGFFVRDAVSTFSWTVVLDDSGGTTSHSFAPFYDADGYVSLPRIVGGLTVGPAAASVSPNGSNYAILVDGSVCFSGGPYDPEYIY